MIISGGIWISDEDDEADDYREDSHPDRCQATFSTPYGDRRCDLAADHGGYHIRNDACGRSEYYWGQR